MFESTLTFWSGWTAGIVVIGLGALAWFAWGVYSARPDDIASPDQTWDETLREGNAPPPKWWFFALFAALIFSAGYMLLYPGFGGFPGVFQWSQARQFDNAMAHYQTRTAATHARWQTAPLAELRADESAMKSARALFANHCAACHGEDAAGQAATFPDLTDAKWHWGGEEAQILQSITAGRTGIMPPWAALGDDKTARLADYVVGLAAGNVDAGGGGDGDDDGSGGNGGGDGDSGGDGNVDDSEQRPKPPNYTPPPAPPATAKPAKATQSSAPPPSTATGYTPNQTPPKPKSAHQYYKA